jgi:addiction module HigA family antidote
MTIRIEDLPHTDFSGVAGRGKRIPPTSPGDILRHEFLEPLGLSANALARALKVPPNRITAILNGRRTVTADTALRLARYFGTTPELWLNLQNRYDLEGAAGRLRGVIGKIKPRDAKAA